jgi:hypothetical protein
MKRIAVALAVLWTIGAEWSATALADVGKIRGPWIFNDLPKAQAEARASGKPIFVVFRCER